MSFFSKVTFQWLQQNFTFIWTKTFLLTFLVFVLYKLCKTKKKATDKKMEKVIVSLG